jgi:hypothetical protein
VVALSSRESKYIATSTAACQATWLSRLLGELMNEEPHVPMMLIDKKSMISLCKSAVFHDRSKHIVTRFHFIRECVEKKELEVDYISTVAQLADILTKALGWIQFQELRSKIGMSEMN